jgi:hypothetical protein
MGRLVSVVFLGLCACAHHPLSAHDLDRVERPAFIARIEENGGPHSTVFRDDASYNDRLKKLDRKEADRRLADKLANGVRDPKTGQRVINPITRFEIADSLRAETLASLPRAAPWLQVINPVDVASMLESFLVEEVPANAPDYELLKPLGADAIVELVVEDFGMRSQDGRAGLVLTGYARLFFINGAEVYYRRFVSDEVKAGLDHLDPFLVAKNPTLFRTRLRAMIAVIGKQLAQDLSPADRAAGAQPTRVAPQAPSKTRPAPSEEDPL